LLKTTTPNPSAVFHETLLFRRVPAALGTDSRPSRQHPTIFARINTITTGKSKYNGPNAAHSTSFTPRKKVKKIRHPVTSCSSVGFSSIGSLFQQM
jgi:hypothetical protein